MRTRRALRIILAAILIAAVSAGIGFAVNAGRRESGLPLIRPEPAALWISLSEAKQAFDQGRTIFLDARLPREYDEGHIPGALNLLVDNLESDYGRVLGDTDKTRPIITYCAGLPCETAAELADALMADYQHKDVLVLGPEAGFEAWRAARYPVETEITAQPTRERSGPAVPIVIIVIGALLALLPVAMRANARLVLVTAARVFIGAMLILAAYGKILESEEFAKGVIAYQAVPDPWANVPAIVVPWMEMITGLLLVVGAVTRGAALVASASLAAFTAMMWAALARGIVIDDCHCFGFAEPLTPVLIVRDVALLAAALVPLFAGAGRLAIDSARRGRAAQA